MFNQTRYKTQITKKVGGSAIIGRHKMLVNMKTGMGFWSSVKGFFSKLAKRAAPVVKKLATDFVNSGKAQDLAKSLVTKGTTKLSDAITKKFGPKTDGLTKTLKELADKGSEKLSTEGTKMALNLIDRIGKKKPKEAAKIAEAIMDSDPATDGAKMAEELLGEGIRIPMKRGKRVRGGRAASDHSKSGFAGRADMIDSRIKALLQGSGLSLI